ncbi:hypothetical protein H2200_010278 [Cladophialophora chaetospira]|uniref:Beta-lactamase/transpeptidase-like protein n=1 Tax=Cladophialophora chaetospira TaxID=386627 RepID=A0AA38X167_9EURO|nr:hypothetical protein H2200_010278 [Cladophialophora chaetospira]
MAELISRIKSLRPLVQEICRISGTAGASIGIIHHGKVLLYENFGYRDDENKKAPDENTIYYLASLSKSFTATGISILVKNGQLGWDTPVFQAYKDLAHQDPEVRARATILDFLSHRTGLAPKNHLWSQEFGRFSLRRDETIRTVTYLEKIAQFRHRWIYSNWGYGVADVLIDKLSQSSWEDVLRTHIFEPLGMHRTTTKHMNDTDDDNVARGYMALKSGKLLLVPEPDGDEGSIIEGALGVKSCVKDLLRYYLGFLNDLKAAEEAVPSHGKIAVFPDAAMMIKKHINLSSESPDLEGWYGLGWVRTRLPSTLGAIGLNYDFVDRMPVVGRGISGQPICLYHQGSANSFLSSVYLLPESQSGVVVLTNSMSKNDAADWLGELYLEEILNSPERNDYVRLARNSAAAAMQLWPAMERELMEKRELHTPMLPLERYVGRYYNIIGNYHIEVLIQDDRLVMRFQREKKIVYPLTHYHYNTFSWLLTHDEDVHVGRFPVTRASFYLIHFKSQGDDESGIDSLVWAHDDEVLDGETFFKWDERQVPSLKQFYPGTDPV